LFTRGKRWRTEKEHNFRGGRGDGNRLVQTGVAGLREKKESQDALLLRRNVDSLGEIRKVDGCRERKREVPSAERQHEGGKLK